MSIQSGSTTPVNTHDLIKDTENNLIKAIGCGAIIYKTLDMANNCSKLNAILTKLGRADSTSSTERFTAWTIILGMGLCTGKYSYNVLKNLVELDRRALNSENKTIQYTALAADAITAIALLTFATKILRS